MSTGPVILDSSVWIEILGSGPLSEVCLKELKSASEVLVPTLILFEVYRKISSATSEDQGLDAIALLTQNTVVDLNQEISLTAADLSLKHGLATADSLILAHAVYSESKLLTLDNDFAGIPGVKVLRRAK